MSVTVHISSPLRKNTNGKSTIKVEAANVADVLHEIKESYPQLFHTICNEDYSIKALTTIYVGDEDIYNKSGLETRIEPADSVYIIPTIAGG